MIKVTGDAKFSLNFDLVVDLTKEQWDALSIKEQDEILDNLIDVEDMASAVMDDAEVWEVKPYLEEI